MNLIQNPGFEDEGWWNYVINSKRTEDYGAASGTWAGRVNVRRIVLPPEFPHGRPVIQWQAGIIETPEMVVDPSGRYALSLLVNSDNCLYSETLRISMNRGLGFADLSLETPTPFGFRPLMFGPIAGSDAAVMTLRLTAAGVPAGVVGWLVDDVELEQIDMGMALKLGKFKATQRLFEALNGITGAEYHNDFAGHVLTTILVPTDTDAPKSGAYLCMPFVNEGETFPEIEDRFIHAKWQQKVYGFLRQDQENRDLTALGAVEAVCNLRDDLLKRLAADWKLGGAVNDTRVVGLNSWAQVRGGPPYGEVQLIIEYSLRFGRDNLGPE